MDGKIVQFQQKRFLLITRGQAQDITATCLPNISETTHFQSSKYSTWKCIKYKFQASTDADGRQTEISELTVHIMAVDGGRVNEVRPLRSD